MAGKSTMAATADRQTLKQSCNTDCRKPVDHHRHMLRAGSKNRTHQGRMLSSAETPQQFKRLILQPGISFDCQGAKLSEFIAALLRKESIDFLPGEQMRDCCIPDLRMASERGQSKQIDPTGHRFHSEADRCRGRFLVKRIFNRDIAYRQG